MIRRISFFLAVTLLGVAPLLAADDVRVPAGKWWQRPEVVRRLELSPEQRRRLDAISRDSSKQLIDLKAELDKRAIDLRTELDRTRLDRSRIQRAAMALNDARSRLFDKELMLMVDLRDVLSDAQWSELRTMMQRAESRRRELPPRRR